MERAGKQARGLVLDIGAGEQAIQHYLSPSCEYLSLDDQDETVTIPETLYESRFGVLRTTLGSALARFFNSISGKPCGTVTFDSRPTPHLFRELHHQPEFGRLLFERQVITFMRTGKATLRA